LFTEIVTPSGVLGVPTGGVARAGVIASPSMAAVEVNSATACFFKVFILSPNVIVNALTI
jgi:hypothetical protein